ncbi:ESX secretion-associated protein EspG [Nocardia sp. NEAU-G5]|uniref:ESX secretion-associated protein EspG n=1 Tax=Nocardia albiluteola TaxID=2842303 RepID=A0ABS6B519_9NOCA|nr:ESX secretion-associated protein EspG [Nocardia albiluteola]MBU3065402.1 ESX secretion-associated protein EspG [Nocardia albiluteola]
MATLTTDGILAVAAALDVQTLPTALAVRPRHTDHGQHAAARVAAEADLRERGVLDPVGDVRDDDLITALFALARPERQLIARIHRPGMPASGPEAAAERNHAEPAGTPHGPDTLIRFCLVRRGLEHAVAVRTGDELDVRTVWADEDPMTLARPLLAVLGPCPPADVPAFSAPTTDLQRCLDAAGTDYTAAAYGLGMPQDDAVTLGLALRQRHSIAEIVCYSHRDGLAVRSPAAAAVYDTSAGRIIGGGSVTAADQTWTTLAPGSDHRMAQVIAALVESLPEGRWMP